VPAVGNDAQHHESVPLEQLPPGLEGQQVLVDVLLCGALVAQHLPADEILVRDHDAEARGGLRDAFHLFEALPHIEEVFEGAEAADVVEGAVAERERLPCPDGDLRAGREALGELHRFVGEVDADCVYCAVPRGGKQRAGATTDVEQPRARRCAEQIEKNRIRRGGTHALQSLRGVVLVIPGFDVFGARHVPER